VRVPHTALRPGVLSLIAYTQFLAPRSQHLLYVVNTGESVGIVPVAAAPRVATGVGAFAASLPLPLPLPLRHHVHHRKGRFRPCNPNTGKWRPGPESRLDKGPGSSDSSTQRTTTSPTAPFFLTNSYAHQEGSPWNGLLYTQLHDPAPIVWDAESLMAANCKPNMNNVLSTFIRPALCNVNSSEMMSKATHTQNVVLHALSSPRLRGRRVFL
jgi:hypothetical protein